MKKVTVTISIGLVAKATETFSVEDDAAEEEIEAMAEEAAMERLDWSYEVSQ